MAGVRKRTAENSEAEAFEKQRIATGAAAPIGEVATQEAPQAPLKEAKKPSASTKRTTAPKAADEAKKTTAGGTKKTTASGAKKTAADGQTEPPVTEAKSAAKKTSTTKKTTTSTAKKSTGTRSSATAKEVPVEISAVTEESALVTAHAGEVEETYPPVGFPMQNVKRNFFARLGVLLLLVAVLTASVFIYLYRPSAYVEHTNSVNFLYALESHRTTVVVNGAVRGTLDGAWISSAQSARGDVCAAVVGDTLYIIRGKNIVPISQNVMDYQLSAGGTALAYRTTDGCLYYRQTGDGGDAFLITKNCASKSYCLSSDGKELVYTYLRDADGVSLLQIESFTDSKPYIESVAGLTPVAVSNRCNYIYFTDENGALYLYNRKAAQRVRCSDAPDAGSITFNRDCTELLFTEGGTTMLFVKGENRRIAGMYAGETLKLLPNRRVVALPRENGVQYMTASFLNSYYLHISREGAQLARLDRRAKLSDLSYVDGGETITVTDKGVFFFLTDYSGTDTHTVLYHIKPGKTEKTRVDWDVAEYQTNVDGSRVLYVSQQGALFSWSASQVTERLCDTIVRGSLTVTADDLFCFYRADGVLAVSDNGRAVRDIATGVQGFLVDTHSIFYITTPPDVGSTTIYINYRNARLGESLGNGYTDFY